MRKRTAVRTALLGAAAIVAAMAAGSVRSDDASGVTVSLCDGESMLTLPGLRPGVALPRAEAQAAADRMMQVWRRNRGEEAWSAWRAEAGTAGAAQAAPAPAAAPAGGQPTKFTNRDQLLWKREQDKWIAEGYKNFHNAAALGGTIGISCDMCHPDASNTHPETYPKFQVQTKKMALLRDMINWCIENPMKGKPLPENDPRLRAVEAYILASRKGVAIEPGKH
ncbi:MAG TPA: cytochrome C [Vicinamibacteria bacterium]|nr:cytochrome C [Vicinamibacteria bacterium]